MPEAASKPIGTLLQPMETITEILLGVIMTLTFTCTLAVTADQLQVRTMLIGALGCNLAWGIIDAGVYLITRINTEGRIIGAVRAIREADDGNVARQILGDSLHPLLASALSKDQLELIRQHLRQMPSARTLQLDQARLASRWARVPALLFIYLADRIAVHIYVGSRTGAACFQCHCSSNACFAWLSVRLSQRNFTLDDGVDNGSVRRRPGWRRNRARGVKAHARRGCRTRL